MGHREDFLKSYGENVLDSLRLPELIREQYRPVSCLKEGQRSVYLVRDRASWPALLKIQPAGGEPSLLREYELLRSLDHPQLPRALAYFSIDGQEYLLREYLPGMSLYELVESRGPLSPASARRVTLSLCRVLDYLHRRNPPVIHRDIKPQNIIIDKDGGCRLIDLGTARRFRSEQPGDTQLMGTQATAPPEQFGYRQTDQRSDIYSVGMLLRYMLSGSLEPLPRGRSCGGLGHVARRCTAFDPRKRYPSASALRRALSPWKPAAAGAAALLILALVLVLPRLPGAADFESAPPEAPMDLRAAAADPEEPSLLEQALRLELGLAQGEAIPTDRLAEVEQLLVCGGELPGSVPEHQLSRESSHDIYISSMSPGDIGNSDLELLRLCTNLRVLVLDYQQISDISALAALPLEYLSLTGNRVEDLSPLAGCTGLQVLDLGENPVKDIRALSGLGSLRELCLDYTGISSLSPLSGLPLEKLKARSVWIKDYSPLESCPSLVSLITGELPSGAWESIARLSTLEELRVYSSSGLDLSLLEGMDRLRDLDVYGSSISNPQALALLPQLSMLNLGETGLSSLDFVPRLPALTGIDLREDPIGDFGVLLDCPYLKGLNISAWQLEQAERQLEGGELTISCG